MNDEDVFWYTVIATGFVAFLVVMFVCPFVFR